MRIKFPEKVDNTLRYLKLKFLPKTLFFRTMLLIFIPLIVTNCIVIGRAEAYASKNSLWHAMFDGFSMGLGMTLSLVVLGALRETIGNGTLFNGMEQLFGESAKALKITLFHSDSHFLLAILPFV